MSERDRAGAPRGGGVGFLGLLTILFIGLKLTGHLTWPWVWVLSPLWLPVAVILAVIVAGVAGVVGLWAVTWVWGRVGRVFAGKGKGR